MRNDDIFFVFTTSKGSNFYLLFVNSAAVLRNALLWCGPTS